MPYVVNLSDYFPPKRFDGNHWTQAQISYSLDNVQAYTVLDTFTLSPVDADPTNPLSRNFTVANAPTPTGWLLVTFLDAGGGQAATSPVQYPSPQGMGASNSSVVSARYAVRHRIRDGVPLLDANPVPFNMVRLEELTDQLITPAPATPSLTVFQVRMDDIPTQRYLNAQVCPGTLVAYVDGSWTPTVPTSDVDQNGNFRLPIPPTVRLLITYAWQYFSDGEIDQFVDEARQWLREFQTVAAVPDGLVPALVSNAASRALQALQRSAMLPSVGAGDTNIDWSKIAAGLQTQADAQYKRAADEREGFYTQGPEALDPTVASFGSVRVGNWTPYR